MKNLLSRAKSILTNEGADAVLIRSINHFVFYTHISGRIRVRLAGVRSPRFFVWFTRSTMRYLHWRYPDRYSDADPFKIIWVNPSIIRSYTKKTPKRRGTVCGGDWDQKTRPFDKNEVYTALRAHFVEDVDWEKTNLKTLFEDLAQDGWAWGHQSTERFEKRCDEIESLYESVATRGLRTQAEQINNNESTITHGDFGIHHPLLNEIGVNIGRDGELIWRVNGQHRLSISKLLDLDRIPVQVVTRHRCWQRHREKLRNGIENVPESVKSHPDMSDILPSD